jgi:UDP-N-acetylmuramate--alanine ligase
LKPKVHLIGIGGAGLSAIATVLLQQGYHVSGSDMQASAATERLIELGATVLIGHRPENLRSKPDMVVISSAIAPDNPELVEARRRGVPALKRAEWLGQMMAGYTGIAIAGTHGKTTTTAMTAFMLHEAGRQPTYIVGGFIPQLNTNAAAGQGQTFVIEADEYDHMFLGLRPQVAVVTIVEWDHPDIYPTQETLKQAFVDFVQLVPTEGLVIACGDDPGVQQVIAQAKAQVITYGLGEQNDWQAVKLQPNRQGGYDFEVTQPGRDTQARVSVSLAIPGIHNVCNALAVLLVARQQGLDLREAAGILGRFRGVNRRFELKGEVNDIIVIDDYAHHPTEIKATLAGARTRFKDHSLWVVFQPHTFSRTLALLDDFAAAFGDADHVIITDIYASREKDQQIVDSRKLVERMTHPDVRHIGSLAETATCLLQRLIPPAVLLTLGAGDGYRVGEWVLAGLGKRGQ